MIQNHHTHCPKPLTTNANATVAYLSLEETDNKILRLTKRSLNGEHTLVQIQTLNIKNKAPDKNLFDYF